MVKKVLLLTLFLISTPALFAQEKSLEDQFNDLNKSSNNYKEFKVVEKIKINALKSSVLDSVASMNQNIELISEENNQQKNTILKLRNDLSSSQNTLSDFKENENTIKTFGIAAKKTTYKIITFSIIIILILIIFILIYKFNNNSRITKLTIANLQENEEEFEGFKHRSLEREQKLRRQLLDEVNRSKDSN